MPSAQLGNGVNVLNGQKHHQSIFEDLEENIAKNSKLFFSIIAH